MGLTVRNMCNIIHELCPTAIIGIQGLVDGNPCDSIALYVYPDDDSYWGEREVSRVDIGRDDRLKIVSVTLSVDIDSSIVIDRTKCKKEVKEKMEQSQNKEPLKLLTQLSYIRGDEGDDVWLEVRLETRDEHGSGYFLFVEGFAEALKSQPGMFENYYVERILYDEPEEGERHLLIQAVKEE